MAITDPLLAVQAASLMSVVEKTAEALFQEAKDTTPGTASSIDKTQIGVMIEKLLTSGVLDWSQPEAAIKAISPDLIKTFVSDLLDPAKPIGRLTGGIVSKVVNEICVTRIKPRNGEAANRTPASIPTGVVHVDFLYDIQSLPNITRKDDDGLTSEEKKLLTPDDKRPLTRDEKKILFEEACKPWIDASKSLNFMDLEDVKSSAGGNLPDAKGNLIVMCRPIDGSGRTLAETTFGEGGKAAKLPEYNIFINATVTWSAERFQAAMTHEIGHLFGLDDVLDDAGKDKVMYWQQIQPYKFRPTQAEIKQFQNLGWG